MKSLIVCLLTLTLPSFLPAQSQIEYLEYSCEQPYLDQQGVKMIYTQTDVFTTGVPTNFVSYRSSRRLPDRQKIVEAILDETITSLEKYGFKILTSESVHIYNYPYITNKEVEMMHQSRALVSKTSAELLNGSVNTRLYVVCDRHWDNPTACTEYEMYSFTTEGDY